MSGVRTNPGRTFERICEGGGLIEMGRLRCIRRQEILIRGLGASQSIPHTLASSMQSLCFPIGANRFGGCSTSISHSIVAVSATGVNSPLPKSHVPKLQLAIPTSLCLFAGFDPTTVNTGAGKKLFRTLVLVLEATECL